MKHRGLVTGSEQDGGIAENYSYVSLFSLNAPFDERGDTIKMYTYDKSTGVPTTVILFGRNETIYWYAFSGEANGKGGRPTVEELITILERAREEQDGSV
jgi:hypothetical protein